MNSTVLRGLCLWIMGDDETAGWLVRSFLVRCIYSLGYDVFKSWVGLVSGGTGFRVA